MTVLEAAPAMPAPSARRLMGTAYALDNVSTADEARAAAGLDWEPVHRALYAEPIDDIDDLKFDDLDFVGKERIVRRSDSGEMLGVVGREHKFLTNEEMFVFADEVLSAADTTWAACEPVAGSLADGRQPFLAVQLGEGVRVAGLDAVSCCLLLSNGHVGNTAFTGTVTPLRVACSNVVRASIRGRSLYSFTIQHSGNMEAKVKGAQEALAVTNAYMREFGDLADRMVAVEMDRAAFDDFLTDLVPLKPDAGERAKKTVEDTRAAFRRNWKDTLTISDDLKPTAWGALNVVTEVIDWGNLDVRRSKVPAPERRVNSVHFGTGARLRDRAFALLGGI